MKTVNEMLDDGDVVQPSPGSKRCVPGVTTPVTDRPLTAEDVALLREGDVLKIVPGRCDAGKFRTFLRATTDGEIVEMEDQYEAYFPDCYVFVSRPPSVSADPVGGVTSGAGEGSAYDRLTGYPDYISDADGLDRIRSALLEVKDWHDLPGAIVNCNSLARLLDTIEMQRAQIAALTPSPPVQLSEREREAVERMQSVAAKESAHWGIADFYAVDVRVDDLRTILAALTRTTGEGS